MSQKDRRKNRGIASVIGVVFILILILTVASTLIISLFNYDKKAQESIELEEERVQEKIALTSLSINNISGTEYLNGINVTNTGTITTRIRAIYIDNSLICDPSDPLLNPHDTYINPKTSLKVQLPSDILYEPLSKIQVATEKGIKSVEYEWILRGGNQNNSDSEVTKVYFGPLLLDFDKFYYTEFDDSDNSYDPNSWKPGWSVEKSIKVVWNITVTNIDDRNITINKYSSFTLVQNAEGRQQPWFIEPPNGQDTQFIPANTTVSIIYIWNDPEGDSTSSLFNQNGEYRVFMSFFGIFHEKDGFTKSYGQTIPFEAVLLRDPQMIITANPTIIAADSDMTSTITVTVRDTMGILAPNIQVTFTTSIGELNPPTTATNQNGVATTVLSPGSTTGTAEITATWGEVSKSTTVIIDSGTLSISANPSTVAANSMMTSTITARVTLNGNPLLGETVTFSATPGLGTLSDSYAITDNLGYARVTFTPGTEVGETLITAQWGGQTGSALIKISSGEFSVYVSPDILAAGSTMTSTITVGVTIDGQPLTGETVNFFATPTLGTLSSTTATTNSEGEVTITYTPGTETGSTTITAEWGTQTDSIDLTIATGEVQIQATPNMITANSSETANITATILLSGNFVTNEEVIFSTNSTQVTLIPETGQTNDSGIITIALSPGTTAEYVEVAATWEGITNRTIITIIEEVP